tara:strand:- start:19262 stop:19714 length:453 start_codon:yes stop_codon:yes gene_type:complete
MLSFKEFITEVFNKPYKWSWDIRLDDIWIAKFDLPDKTNLEIEFEFVEDDHWEIQFTRNGGMEVTGEGDQFRIFATVIDAAKKFIKNYKGEYSLNFIEFSAEKIGSEDSNSRIKLYERLMKKFARQFGYDGKMVNTYDFIIYKMKKKKKK